MDRELPSNRALVMAHDEGDVLAVTVLDARIMDSFTIQDLFDQIQTLVDARLARKLVINMENVEYLSSSALGRMMKLHKFLAADKGALKLCHLKEPLQQIFHITKMDSIIKIHRTTAEAAKAFQRRLGVF